MYSSVNAQPIACAMPALQLALEIVGWMARPTSWKQVMRMTGLQPLPGSPRRRRHGSRSRLAPTVLSWTPAPIVRGLGALAADLGERQRLELAGMSPAGLAKPCPGDGVLVDLPDLAGARAELLDDDSADWVPPSRGEG